MTNSRITLNHTRIANVLTIIMTLLLIMTILDIPSFGMGYLGVCRPRA